MSYINDGDTSSFNEVDNSKPYDDFEIIKKECVRHMQKSLEARLRTFQITVKGKFHQMERKYLVEVG